MVKKEDRRVVLGRRLKALRKQRGWTQERMAERAGLSWKYYSEIERGRRNASIDSIRKIADGLEISMSGLFLFIDDSQLTDDEEQIIASVTRILAKADKKTKRKVRVLLREFAD